MHLFLLVGMSLVTQKLAGTEKTENQSFQNPIDSSAASALHSSPPPVDTLSEKKSCFSPPPRRLIHTLGFEYRPEYILPTNSFVRGDNDNLLARAIEVSNSFHLRYSFHFQPGTSTDHIYHRAYQGIGLAYYDFNEPERMGSPVAVYLFQGARLGQISRRLTFNYEWNFGLSFGWKPYDFYMNPDNKAIGSRVNAYINTNFYFNWTLSRNWDLATGISVAHFSNGNTKFPNGGLNTFGLKLGLVYHLTRSGDDEKNNRASGISTTRFPTHLSYDLVLFGAWRRKAVRMGEELMAAPGSYSVGGFNFSPMYNLGYCFRAGVSLDGVYDSSANIYAYSDLGSTSGSVSGFRTPSLDKQMSLGLSARSELVMPYFRINLGIGHMLHGIGDQKGLYQLLALKIEMTRSSFLHIGYNIKDFHLPNFLMIGVGYRFHDKYPFVHR
jgi:hypothetical protein